MRRAANAPPPHAAPSAARTASACLRRPRARSSGMFVRLIPTPSSVAAVIAGCTAKGHVRDKSANVFNKVIRAQRGLMRTTRQSLANEPAKNSRRRSGISRCATCGGWLSGACRAAGALVLVVYGGTTTRTAVNACTWPFAEIHDILFPSASKPIRPLDAREGRRLAETVRALAADRERLLARVATLEQSIEDITGSIARVEKATKAQPDADSRSGARPPPPRSPPAEDTTASINPPAGVSASTAAAQPSQTSPRPNSASISAAPDTRGSAHRLGSALRSHGTLLEGLRPVVQMRERPRPGGIELRLIAGPIPNAAAAARLCARDDGGGRGLRARGIRRPAARRPLNPCGIIAP